MQQTPSPSRNWLASAVFLFITLYLQLSAFTAASLISVQFLLFMVIGLLMSALLVDLPAHAVQKKLPVWLKSDAITGHGEQAPDKAAVVATFVKAAQVVIAFTAGKYAFMQLMM
ncbi:MAG: hypothetical protein V7739_16115 [Motiliproteus sp.]